MQRHVPASLPAPVGSSSSSSAPAAAAPALPALPSSSSSNNANPAGTAAAVPEPAAGEAVLSNGTAAAAAGGAAEVNGKPVVGEGTTTQQQQQPTSMSDHVPWLSLPGNDQAAYYDSLSSAPPLRASLKEGSNRGRKHLLPSYGGGGSDSDEEGGIQVAPNLTLFPSSRLGRAPLGVPLGPSAALLGPGGTTSTLGPSKPHLLPAPHSPLDLLQSPSLRRTLGPSSGAVAGGQTVEGSAREEIRALAASAGALIEEEAAVVGAVSKVVRAIRGEDWSLMRAWGALSEGEEGVRKEKELGRRVRRKVREDHERAVAAAAAEKEEAAALEEEEADKQHQGEKDLEVLPQQGQEGEQMDLEEPSPAAAAAAVVGAVGNKDAAAAAAAKEEELDKKVGDSVLSAVSASASLVDPTTTTTSSSSAAAAESTAVVGEKNKKKIETFAPSAVLTASGSVVPATEENDKAAEAVPAIVEGVADSSGDKAMVIDGGATATTTVVAAGAGVGGAKEETEPDIMVGSVTEAEAGGATTAGAGAGEGDGAAAASGAGAGGGGEAESGGSGADGDEGEFVRRSGRVRTVASKAVGLSYSALASGTGNSGSPSPPPPSAPSAAAAAAAAAEKEKAKKRRRSEEDDDADQFELIRGDKRGEREELVPEWARYLVAPELFARALFVTPAPTTAGAGNDVGKEDEKEQGGAAAAAAAEGEKMDLDPPAPGGAAAGKVDKGKGKEEDVTALKKDAPVAAGGSSSNNSNSKKEELLATEATQEAFLHASLLELHRFLADATEYTSRLAEIRDGVLGIERRRKGMWKVVRMVALDWLEEEQNAAQQQQMQMGQQQQEWD